MESGADNRSLVVVRKLQATPRAIWRALTEPNLLKQWLVPGKIVVVHADVRVGGGYRIAMSSVGAAGGVFGEYREVAPNEKLVYTWANAAIAEPASVVTFELTVAGDATELLLKHEGFPDEATRDGEELAWGRRIRRLARVIG